MQQPEKMVLVVNDCPLLADCGEFDFVRATTVPIQFQVFEWLLVSNKPDTFAFEWDNRIGGGEVRTVEISIPFTEMNSFYVVFFLCLARYNF